MKHRAILIIDDEIQLLTMLKSVFIRNGYTNITLASCANQALELIRIKMPDMIITDIMMPGMDGYEFLQEVRSISKVPILMLSAKGEPQDRFDGFELGADDYLVKPFLPKELLLRVEAILRRTYPEEKRRILLDASVVDLDQAMVIKNDQKIALTGKEYAIFQKLSENRGRIVTVGALCQCVCGDEWKGYETSLMTHIRHLREKIEEDPSNPKSIVTFKGLGYQLI